MLFRSEGTRKKKKEEKKKSRSSVGAPQATAAISTADSDPHTLSAASQPRNYLLSLKRKQEKVGPLFVVTMEQAFGAAGHLLG